MIPINLLVEYSLSQHSVIEAPLSQVIGQLKEIHDMPQITNKKKDLKFYGIKDPKTQKWVGIAVIDPQPKENTGMFDLTKTQLGHDVELVFFYVYEQYRNQGLGSQLLNFVISKYKDKYIGLGTGKQTTEEAKKLYNKYGFHIVVQNIGKSPFQWWLRKPS